MAFFAIHSMALGKNNQLNALIDIVNQVQSHFDEGMLSCGVFIDLKKAFDTIDTNLLYADRDINSLERVVNAELSKVQEWLVANRLTLNAKMSNFVIFHPYQKNFDRDVILKIFDIETNDFVLLDKKTYIKYLGILIDSSLTWKYHISYITSKISKTIGVIARLRHFVPTSTLLTFYRSLLSPYLLYGLTVWGQAPQIYLNQILVVQKRALRLTYFAPYGSSTVSLFVSSGSLPISLLYYY